MVLEKEFENELEMNLFERENIKDLEENIRVLQKKFLQIKNMEYVKSVRKGNTGIGATFESLLEKNEESFEIPDFYGIEIKTRRSYSKSLITLFNAVPTGGSFYEVKRLRDTYGYRDPDAHDLKKLNTMVGADELVKVGLWYYFKIRVDREKEKVYLEVYDWNKVLIDSETYWDFDILKEKLYRKLRVLALVKAWPNRINGYEYFKYYKMNIYLLKGFQEFIELLEEGSIKVLFKIGNYYDEKRYGNVHSHGVGFAIREEDLVQLFELYR